MRAAKTYADQDSGGLTCLVNLADHFGVDGQVVDFLPLCRGFERPANLFSLIHLARLLDLEAVPLEGSFADLAGCDLPLIAPLRGSSPRFVVVVAIDTEAVQILDPVHGLQRVPVAQFREDWERDGQGDALDVRPGSAFETLPRRLRDASNPWLRLRWQFGLRAPWSRKLIYLAALLCLPLTLALYESGALALALGSCLLAALWSWLFGASCASCHGAARLVGMLPLAPMGTLFYALALVLALTRPSWLPLPLTLAVGAHGALMVALLRARTTCIACLVVAASALAAAGIGFLGSQVPWSPWLAALIPTAALATTAATAWGRRQWRLVALERSLALAARPFSVATAPDEVHILVYKRADCAHCLLYEAMIRPALEQEFAGQLHFQEHLTEHEPIDVPLMILHGRQRVLVLELRGDDAHNRARAAVIRAASPPSPGSERALTVFGADTWEPL